MGPAAAAPQRPDQPYAQRHVGIAAAAAACAGRAGRAHVGLRSAAGDQRTEQSAHQVSGLAGGRAVRPYVQ